jgi:hypothetical protein
MEQIKQTLIVLVKTAETAIPGASGKEKKAWCIDQVVKGVELGDNYIPIIGAWMDLPVIDGFERWLIGLAVEWAYTSLQLPS